MKNGSLLGKSGGLASMQEVRFRQHNHLVRLGDSRG